MAVMFDNQKFPLWFDDIEAVSIASADFNPITDLGAVPATEHQVGRYIRNGFGVRNGSETAAFIRAITLAQYRANNKSLVGIVPRTIYLNGGDWCLTPVVKVFAANSGTYPSTGMTNVNIGLII